MVLLVMVSLVLKFLLSTFVVLPFGYSGRSAVAVGAATVQIGEFSFMLAKQGMDAGALTQTQYTMVLGAALVTIILPHVSIDLTPQGDSALPRVPLLKRWFEPQVVPLHWEEPQTLKDHVIVARHGRVGARVTEVLTHLQIPFVVIERDHNLIVEIRQRNLPVVYGDAAYARVLAHTHAERARSLAVCLPDCIATKTVIMYAKEIDPDMQVIARVSRRTESMQLCSKGVIEAIEPEFQGSLEMLRHILTVFNVDEKAKAEELVKMRLQSQCEYLNRLTGSPRTR